MFLCYPDEWRTGLKALRADSISILKKAFPELVQEVILSPQTLSYVQVSHAYQRFNLWTRLQGHPISRISTYMHFVIASQDKKKCIEIPAACELLNLVLSFLNNAACKLRLNDYKEAKELCTEVLESDNTNVKALYRRAQAHMHLVDLDLAEADIKKALEIDPDNRDVKMGYKRLKEKVKEYKRRDAKLYGNMISKLSKLEDTEDNGQMSQTVNKKCGLLWPLSEMVRRFFTADGSKGFTLWPALRLLIPDEWRTGLKALRADSISKLKKAFPELVQEVSRPSNFQDFYIYAFRYCLTGLQFHPQVDKLNNYLMYQNDYKAITMDQWMGFIRL
ncbi:Defective in cullin neddylation protein [Zea mays]|uniref:Defective in cullin neddylation protein n=1 Tax=Zea mays TaxID=4577 RepID=A0A1D6EZA1_MAIZE|nr:Defective in cullin neddylation protein [Zea mays]